MYHRFNENKYPSTNIKMDIFEEHINIIKNSDFNFHNPNNFDEQFNKPKQKKEIPTTSASTYWPAVGTARAGGGIKMYKHCASDNEFE